MGGNLTQALRIANSGLLVGQQSLDVVARNIANVNTPGYSRKVINLEQCTLAGHGAGVKFGALSRRIDDGLLSLLRRETGTLKQKEAQTDSLDRLQQLFGTPESNASLSHVIAELQASIEALAVTPQDVIEQQTVVRWGGEVASMLRRSSQEIQNLRQEADSRIGNATSEINTLLKSVSDLNVEIVRNLSLGNGAADLEDQRDQSLDRLAELMDVHFSGRPNGEVVVFTAGGRTLVDSAPVSLSHISAVSAGASVTQAEGDFDGIYAGDRISDNDITNDIRTGELKGLIELRDTMLPAMQSTLDELSARLRDVINAVHNRGTGYPGLTSFSGSRVFDAPATERITFPGLDNDTALVLFDASGAEVARTTVRTLVGGPTTTIENLRAQLDAWTPSAAIGNALDASFDTDGKLVIDVKVAGFNLAFRDQLGTPAGSDAQDATIDYDPDGAGTAPSRSYSGFSGFFGLNDFFVDATGPSVHETPVLAKSWTYSGANTTLSFRHNGATTTQAISSGDSLEAIVGALETVPGLAVALIPDGAGVRLSVSSTDGKPLMISENDGTNKEPFLAASGLKIASVGSSSTLAVRGDIVATPSLVSRGRVQWDETLSPAGKYVLAPGDAEIAREMAAAFSSFTDFGIAGRLGATRATFAEYAASFISDASVLATTNRETSEYQGDLVASLQQKSDSLRGVNLDEEVSGLMLYEQAYSAAARVIQVVQQMFESLEQAVR